MLELKNCENGKWSNSRICDRFSEVHRAIFEGRRAKGTANSRIYEGKREKQIFVIDVNSNQYLEVHFRVWYVRSVYKKENLPSRRPDRISFSERRERVGGTEKWPILVSLSLSFDSLESTWKRSRMGPGEFCMENNSVPRLFGNVAADGDLNSRGEM